MLLAWKDFSWIQLLNMLHLIIQMSVYVFHIYSVVSLQLHSLISTRTELTVYALPLCIVCLQLPTWISTRTESNKNEMKWTELNKCMHRFSLPQHNKDFNISSLYYPSSFLHQQEQHLLVNTYCVVILRKNYNLETLKCISHFIWYRYAICITWFEKKGKEKVLGFLKLAIKQYS